MDQLFGLQHRRTIPMILAVQVLPAYGYRTVATLLLSVCVTLAAVTL